MANKNPLFKKVQKFVATAILLYTATTLGADISGENLLNLLGERDRAFNSIGYKISFAIATQHNQFNDPSQGMVLMDCTVTRTEEGCAMKITNHYEHPPVFATRTKPGDGSGHDYRGFDYDHNGNLIVWRTMGKYILSTPNRNDTLEKVRVFLVDPNDQIVETGDNIKLHRWPIGSLDSMYEFRQFQLGAGRGFSKHLGAVKSIDNLPSGLKRVKSKDKSTGNWELTIDPSSDYLVRKAFLTKEGMDEPTIEVTSSGVIENDVLRIAEYGTYKSSMLKLSFEVADISKVVGRNELYEEVQSFLNEPLLKGASIIDLRGKEPVRTTVK